MSGPNEDRIAELLRALPPAPEAWVQAAQEIPFARDEIAAILERAAADEEFRKAVAADPETTLASEGYELDPAVVQAIHQLLAEYP